jgi:hypothetical protein
VAHALRPGPKHGQAIGARNEIIGFEEPETRAGIMGLFQVSGFSGLFGVIVNRFLFHVYKAKFQTGNILDSSNVRSENGNLQRGVSCQQILES